jgi:hypothetical protein
MYDPATGKLLDTTPIILKVNNDETKCYCSLAAKARRVS